MTWHTVKVQVDLPDIDLDASYIDSVAFVERPAVVAAVDSWADAIERAHGDQDIVNVLRTLSVALAGEPA